jgi:hypothetical protein
MPTFSKTRVLIFIIVVLLLANLAMLIFFLSMHDNRKKHTQQSNRGANVISTVLQQKVGFTKEQMDKVSQLRSVHREKMHSLFQDIRLAKIKFYGQINTNEVTDSVLYRDATTIGEKQRAIDLQAFKNIREIRNLCTTEQLPKFDSLIPGVLQNMWFPSRRSNNQKDSDSLKKVN